MVSKNKTGILLNIDKELKEKLIELASKEERTLTSYINYVLKKHIEEKEKETD